jgi:hypothetical protein
MRRSSVLWRLAFAGCEVVDFVLTPLSLLTTWLAKLARRGRDRAEIALLHAAARSAADSRHPRTLR